jgi:hypothetical protein
MRCFGDIVVDLSEQIEKQKSAPKKVLGNRKMDLDKSHAVSEMLIAKSDEMQSIVEAKDQKASQPNPANNRNRNRNRSRGRNRNRK